MKKVAINTLGCRSNQLESSILADEFVKNGWQIVKFNEIADIYIINTCTVTGKTDSASRNLIRKAKRNNNDAKIIVTGCYAQTSPEEIAQMVEVDLVIGNIEKQNLFDILVDKGFLVNNNEKIIVSDIMQEDKFDEKKVFSASGRTRANIKIQNGCNNRCSYCIIPYARGKSRSNSLENVIEQVRDIAKNGYKEVILSGIHLGQWGLDLKPKNSLSNLLKELEKIDELKRYRISSVDPTEFDDDLINTLVNSKKFCQHLHISLQSGNNEILKAMRRGYSVEEFSNLINRLIDNIPNLAIGSDIIVGFPGETDEFFNDTYNNLEKLPISYIHVFTFSRRKGTPASEMDNQIPDNIKKARNARLQELAARKNLEFRQKQLGNELEILVEFARDKKTGMLKGLSRNYIPVLLEGSDNLKNKLLNVKISEVTDVLTKGKLI